MVAILRTTAILLAAWFRRWFLRQDKNLQGQVAMVTGAGSDLGREMALKLASSGCHVICVDIDSVANEATTTFINAQVGPASASALTCDVSARLQVLDMSRRVLKERDRVDLLVNIAASDAIEENLMAHFWTLLAFLPAMLTRDQGHVVGICNAAVAGMMDALSQELRLDSSSIKLTCVDQHSLTDVTPALAAEEIVSAIRKNVACIPRSLLSSDTRGLHDNYTGLFLKMAT